MLPVFLRTLSARPLLTGFVVGFVGYISFSPAGSAQYHPNVPATTQANVIVSRDARIIWSILSPQQQQMVDRLAADFFENKLSLPQRQRIIAAQTHATAHESAARQDHARKNASHQPTFTQLTTAQKHPFRQYGIDQLGIRVEVPAAYTIRSNRSI